MSRSIDEIRVCVVGYGLAGRVFHAPFVSAVPGLRLSAVVTSREQSVHAAWPQAAVFPSLAEALRQADGLDLVVVAAPNETHAALAREALEAGRHVVVDKPLAGSSAEVRDLAALAATRGVLLAPFHNRRWDGDFLTLAELLRQGTLGRVVSLESHFDRFRPLVREGSWKETASAAHGLLMDLGPHLVDQALALFGAPAGVFASVRRERSSTGVDDAFDLWLEYAGMQVLLRSTLLAADPQPRFLLHATKGSFRKLGVDPQEPALVAGAKVPTLGSATPWLPEPESAWGELTLADEPARPDELRRSRVPTLPGDYRLFYRNVRDAIRGDATLAVTPQDAWRTLQILELARESSDSGRRLPVAWA